MGQWGTMGQRMAWGARGYTVVYMHLKIFISNFFTVWYIYCNFRSCILFSDVGMLIVMLFEKYIWRKITRTPYKLLSSCAAA